MAWLLVTDQAPKTQMVPGFWSTCSIKMGFRPAENLISGTLPYLSLMPTTLNFNLYSFSMWTTSAKPTAAAESSQHSWFQVFCEHRTFFSVVKLFKTKKQQFSRQQHLNQPVWEMSIMQCLLEKQEKCVTSVKWRVQLCKNDIMFHS